MANLKNAIPASFRPSEDYKRFSQGLIAHSGRSVVLGTAFKSRFQNLPEEPEDARITGATRSLSRRLLALNLRRPILSN